MYRVGRKMSGKNADLIDFYYVLSVLFLTLHIKNKKISSSKVN